MVSKGTWSAPALLILMTTMSCLGATNAMASDQPDHAPVPCSSINPRTAAIHTKCVTSKGGVFERVSYDGFGEAWRDSNGLVWSDVLVQNDHLSDDGHGTLFEAFLACEEHAGKIPSREEYERDEERGFREVLPHMNRSYWSDTGYHEVRGEDTDYDSFRYIDAYLFDGKTGAFSIDNARFNHFTRCVSYHKSPNWLSRLFE